MTDFDDDKAIKHRSKKNTRKWCKGKKGVLHDFSWRENKSYVEWMQFSCDKCGKIEDMWYPFLMSTYSDAKPKIGSKEPLKRTRITHHEI